MATLTAPIGETRDATRATESTHTTGTDISTDTGVTTVGKDAAAKDTGNPIVMTAPATGSASGFAINDTTGTDPNTYNEMGKVPS